MIVLSGRAPKRNCRTGHPFGTPAEPQKEFQESLEGRKSDKPLKRVVGPEGLYYPYLNKGIACLTAKNTRITYHRVTKKLANQPGSFSRPEMKCPAATGSVAHRADQDTISTAYSEASAYICDELEAIAQTARSPLSGDMLTLIDLLQPINARHGSGPSLSWALTGHRGELRRLKTEVQ